MFYLTEKFGVAGRFCVTLQDRHAFNFRLHVYVICIVVIYTRTRGSLTCIFCKPWWINIININDNCKGTVVYFPDTQKQRLIQQQEIIIFHYAEIWKWCIYMHFKMLFNNFVRMILYFNKYNYSLVRQTATVRGNLMQQFSKLTKQIVINETVTSVGDRKCNSVKYLFPFQIVLQFIKTQLTHIKIMIMIITQTDCFVALTLITVT